MMLPRWSVLKAFRRLACAGALLLAIQGGLAQGAGNAGMERRFREILDALPPLKLSGTNFVDSAQRTAAETEWETVQREKLEGRWLAALVNDEENEAPTIQKRFATWAEFVDFLQTRDPLVEMWAYPPAGEKRRRRITAHEWNTLRQAGKEQPHLLTVTFRTDQGRVQKFLVEFGYDAARQAWSAQQSYARHRELLLAANEILGGVNEPGGLRSLAQWNRLVDKANSGEFEIQEMPPQPWENEPAFIAVEYAVDDNGNFIQPVRMYREEDIRPLIEGGPGVARQILKLRRNGMDIGRAESFRTRGTSDVLEPATNSLAGQDSIQIRVRNPNEPDARKWNVIEFGAPELLSQAALARFSLINAQMERYRKELALKKSKIDLIAEPIIAGLNIGGGVSGVGFPIGETARLGYNIFAPKWIANVPNVSEMREIFAILAARSADPARRDLPLEFMSRDDVAALREAGKKLSDEEVRRYLEHLSEEDVKAIIRLARMGMIDARVTNFLNVLTSAYKVSGESEQAGLLRDLFNNVRFSPNGDINLKSLIALAAGKRIWTAESGVSLEELARGDGPSEAWTQFFEVSVDIRAVINSVARAFKRTLAKKELEKPFPYATRLGDLAAYEVRIFGFPLLLFYKTGLIRDDLQAFENDYAYGVIGTRIVTRFPKKEDIEREVLAGRLFPLGLVKVWDGKNGWRETRLAVFANRLETGKHKGKIALVVYGLKAYREYSELMERELKRFEQFERVLREGGVIQRVTQAQSPGAIPQSLREPQISIGAEALQKDFAGKLAALLESKCLEKRRELGLNSDESPPQRSDAVVATREHLLETGKYHSAFVYERERDGNIERVQVNAIPALREIQTALEKAEFDRNISRMRQEVALGERGAILFINEVKMVDGRSEPGVLLQVRASSKPGEPGEDALALLDHLSAADKWRLAFNHFAGTIVSLDWRGDGQPESVFVTAEFPQGRSAQTSTNASTGVVERRIFEGGRLRESATTRRLSIFHYNDAGLETGSLTFRNSGTLETPEEGRLIETTRTIEFRPIDTARELDPYAPTISKLKLNHITGAISVETYGLFPQPVKIVDEQFVTIRKFSDNGELISSAVFENGTTLEDQNRAILDKLINPIQGRELRRSNLTTGQSTTENQNEVTEEDLLTGTSRTIVYDLQREGRPVEERFTDDQQFQVRFEYDDDWLGGTVPVKATVQSMETGNPLRTIEYIQFDPDQRLLKGVETDYRGIVSTQTWDYRWSAPIESETALRKTTVRYDTSGMKGQGQTIDKASGDVVRTFSVDWNAGQKHWEVVDTWFMPGNVVLRVETNWLSGFGRFIQSDSGPFRTVAVYDGDGREAGRQTWRKNVTTGEFDLPARVESDFKWNSGRRDAEITTWVDGRVYARSRSISDPEGRTIVEGIRTIGGVGFRTDIRYAGGSESPVEAVTTLGGKTRATRKYGAPIQSQSDGWLLPVALIPAWGVSSTNFYKIGDEFGRWTETRRENGTSSRVIEWYDGTAIPKLSEVSNAEGRVVEQWRNNLHGSLDHGETFDLLTREEVSPWGVAAVAEKRALAPGTDLLIYRDGAGDRTYYDLENPIEAPSYSRILRGGRGLNLQVGKRKIENASKIFRARLDPLPQERLVVDEVDLTGLFAFGFNTQVFDRSGHLLEQTSGVSPKHGEIFEGAAQIFAQVESSAPVQRLVFQYKPGWWVPDREASAKTKSFYWTNAQPISMPGAFSVNRAGPEQPVRIDGAQFIDLEGGAGRKTIASRKLVELNPWLPHLQNSWTEWTTREFSESGRLLSEKRVIYQADGLPVTSRLTKSRSGHRIAEKIEINVPEPLPGEWKESAGGRGRSIELLDAPADLRKAVFLYFFLRDPNSRPILVIRDAAGKEISVAPGGDPSSNGMPIFWPIGSGWVYWAPNEKAPVEGFALNGPGPGSSDEDGAGLRMWAVAVASLQAAGLDTAAVSSVSLRVDEAVQPKITHTHLRFVVDPRSAPFNPEQTWHFEEHEYSSGLRWIIRHAGLTNSPGERSPPWASTLLWNGSPVVTGVQRNSDASTATLVTADYSDPLSPRPLYAATATDSHFLQWYQTFRSGDQTRVYSVVNGFESPKLEIFFADRLEDELMPGLLVYGRDIPVVLPMGREGGIVPAAIKRRVQASAFKYAANEIARGIRQEEDPGEELLRLNHSTGAISRQPNEIARLPTVAEMLAPFQALPWTGAQDSPSGLWSASTNGILLDLGKMAAKYPTGLVPSAIGGEAEQFVSTVREAAIVNLVIALGGGSLAGAILDFYWNQSQGGTQPLFDCYDAATGASVRMDPSHARPVDSRKSASAQLAIAESAFRLHTATGDTNALHFARNLLRLLAREYRNSTPDANLDPEGISEEVSIVQRKELGLAFLPPPRRFRLETNAKYYQLLTKLASVGLNNANIPDDDEWRAFVQSQLVIQENWIRKNFLTENGSKHPIPTGVFQLQDVDTGESALAQERWTSSDDWLSFIEAAQLMGVNSARCNDWLETLARAHGARVNDIWGLRWGVPVLGPEVISPRLTARFYKVARQLGNNEAASFAARQLGQMQTTNGFPEVIAHTPAKRPIATGDGEVLIPSASAGGWSIDASAWEPLLASDWAAKVPQATPMRAGATEERDMSSFFWTAAAFYLAVLAVALFWWAVHSLRQRKDWILPLPIVPDPVMRKAEERWARRVLGVISPAGADRTRFSNAPLDENFHMQLRAIYKLVLEWRRIENGWTEEDPRLVEDGGDPWLNGLDEFAVMIGIYSRWVVKAGKKDGFGKSDPLQENEDSNHVWSRLVCYLSEYLWGVLQLVNTCKSNPEAARVFGVNEQIHSLLRVMGARSRPEPFDARILFNYPADPSAFDLLHLQLPGASLASLSAQMEATLRIPKSHFRGFLKNYKSFKHREQIDPVHPYIIESAKLLPHFLLMGLVSVIWYNQDVNGLLIYPYLKQLAAGLFQSWNQGWWLVPFGLGVLFGLAAKYVKFSRYGGAIRSARKEKSILEADIGSFTGSGQSTLPSIRPGKMWDPVWYEKTGWILRGAGLVGLGAVLMNAPAPSLATFTLVKGLFVPLLFLEGAAILVPLLLTVFSKWMEDRVSSGVFNSRAARFINQLNITPTRPASILWLAIKYHFQPSLPSGSAWEMVRCILFYFFFTACFFLIGSYSFKEVLRVWFAQRYHQAWDWELAIGSLVFWNTMYLLRFGLFVFFVSAASFLLTFPVQACAIIFALAYSIALWLVPAWARDYFPVATLIAVILILLSFLIPRMRSRWGKSSPGQSEREEEALREFREGDERALAVVYMSGDDLSSAKLAPDVLLNRLQILKKRLGSEGIAALLSSLAIKDESKLVAGWTRLHALEKSGNVTLWHPMQLVAPGEPPVFEEQSGLNICLESDEERQSILQAWEARRWLVTMMSTAGHAQDTAINLADIALKLNEQGIGRSCVFYLIQNKYDNNDNNRPAQARYDEGALAQRNKLARLLMFLAPGSRACSINDWTPFGFKAGALAGMDLIFEDSLKLRNMLVLDRNATTHDLDALMDDLKTALSDPGVIIVVPGRSTTNALTPLGQASQLVEEGHREMMKGLMAIGGGAGESVGTGWGNIQAVGYGAVQRALLDPNTPKMPLTSRMWRGSSFYEKTHGLIGFGPHAVGISEDIWGVTQAAHNAMALGQTVRFRQSKAFWHKIRETWSHAEWFSAFPRWSGGYLQMMLDPLMQKINDTGPLSVFAKEIRANCGRFFLSAPFALLNILLMPLAIILDISPFVQVLVVLWLFGLVMNQVLTLLGCVSYLESSGFSRRRGLAGAVALGLTPLLDSRLRPWLPVLIMGGFLSGGFVSGFIKWLFHRGRDLIVFGPQLVIHALGQVVRQSLEFVLSGASADDAKGVNIAFRGWVGPREDRPWENYANLINLRTVIWGVGLFSLALNLFALSQLDFLNALLLLPSLFFSISALAGPFLLSPKPGSSLGSAGSFVPRIAGWTAAFAYFLLLAVILSSDGPAAFAGLILFLLVAAAMARHGLKYVGFTRRLRRKQRRLEEILRRGGLDQSKASVCARDIVRAQQGDPVKVKPALARMLPGESQAAEVLRFCETELHPFLRKPLLDVRGVGGGGRWMAEFKRSFTLGFFTLIWFLLVPLPGLLVFSGLGYRVSISLISLMQVVIGGVALTIICYAVMRGLEIRDRKGKIQPRLNDLYRRFQSLFAKKALNPEEVSGFFAVFTDAVTYTDQRSHAYALRTLGEAESLLLKAERRLNETRQ